MNKVFWFGLLFLIPCFPGIARSGENTALVSATNSITADDLKRHIQVLASDTYEGRESGSRGGKAAGEYLSKEMESLRLNPGGPEESWFQNFGRAYRNILGVLPGNDEALKDEIVVVGAHYDHVGYGNRSNSDGPYGYIHNGADDNASGTSMLLETAEAFSKLPMAPRRTILFALWDAEERGMYGSKHWVAYPTLPLKQVKLLVNVDMIGRLKDRQLEVYGYRTAPGLRRLLSELNTEGDLRFDFKWEMPPNSDHQPFYERRIPIVMPFTGYHDDYHRPSDDVEKLNLQGIEQISRWMFAVIHEMANRDEIPAFRETAFRESASTRKGREVAAAPRPGRLGISWNPRDEQGGLLITRVNAGSAAEKGGLQVGDRLLNFAGYALTHETDLRPIVLSARNPVQVQVQRSGENELLTKELTLSGTPARVGIAWREDDAEPGVVSVNRVDPGSPAEQAGLHLNDRILTVNDKSFADATAFRSLIGELPFPLDVRYERFGQVRRCQIDFPSPATATNGHEESQEASAAGEE